MTASQILIILYLTVLVSFNIGVMIAKTKISLLQFTMLILGIKLVISSYV